MKAINKRQEKINEMLSGIELDRWSKCVPHDERSERIMSLLMDVDWLAFNDYFRWRNGGDGDNGETLMYELDAVFELLDMMDAKSV